MWQLYRTELTRVETPHHVVTGGFHFNPKAIELALKVSHVMVIEEELT